MEVVDDGMILTRCEVAGNGLGPVEASHPVGRAGFAKRNSPYAGSQEGRLAITVRGCMTKFITNATRASSILA
jgi:hypothetical protein